MTNYHPLTHAPLLLLEYRACFYTIQIETKKIYLKNLVSLQGAFQMEGQSHTNRRNGL